MILATQNYREHCKDHGCFAAIFTEVSAHETSFYENITDCNTYLNEFSARPSYGVTKILTLPKKSRL